MPRWHEATKDLQNDGKLQMVRIIQEQHPDGARLFVQLEADGWPILVDSYNLLDVPVVPSRSPWTKHGAICQINPPRRDVERLELTFLSPTFDPPAQFTGAPVAPDLIALEPPDGTAT